MTIEQQSKGIKKMNDMNKGGIWPVVKKKSLANQIIDWDRNSKTIKALDAWATAAIWVLVASIIITLGIKILLVNL